MVTKKELIEVARKGNWFNRGGSELACIECGCYDYESKHEKDCPVGVLLSLIEKVVPE